MSVLHTILNTFFPSTCVGCGEVLVGNENQLCVSCLSQLPATHFSATPDNEAERMLIGKIPFVAVSAMLQFQHGNKTQRIIHSMKFHGNSDLCLLMGRQMGLDLARSGRFDDIDLLLPVPLHWIRHLKRGYNQSELLCRGMSEVLGVPINTTALKRVRYTRKQSQQQRDKRQTNVENAFRTMHPEQLKNKHILLVDDVMTTGATLTSCCDALANVYSLRISIATLSIATY
ncbi:MAG: ComF family protein [Bacteroidales bacterium]|nr:ComF family protein [Bacteroidales bacterium]